MERITHFYRLGSSDKTYQASLEPKDGSYVVHFAYGRRGSALQTGTKTSTPVAYDAAKKIYDQLVASNVAKGYQPGEDRTPYQNTGKAAQATGIYCQLLNPIIEDPASYHRDSRKCPNPTLPRRLGSPGNSRAIAAQGSGD